jgi:PAS domain S-box-containing protein
MKQNISEAGQIAMAPQVLHSHDYSKFLDLLTVPVYTTDTKGVINYYNHSASILWGRKPEIGKELWNGSYKILHLDGSEMDPETSPMAICLKEKRPVIGKEIQIVRPDGSIRIVNPHPQPILDDNGEMVGALNMLIDVTEVKKAETVLKDNETVYRKKVDSLGTQVLDQVEDLKNKNRELKKSEERYHKMVEEVEDYAIILLDKNGIVQNWNKGAEKIKGYKEHEIVGRSFSNFYLPEDRAIGLPDKLLKKGKEEGKALHEGWRMRKDGTRFWGSIVITALHDSNNNLIGFTKVTRDLTERKLAEDKLKEYTNQLEFQNKELEQFAYAASHDMKEPLRKIHLYNTSIADDPNNKLDDRSRDFLSRSINAAKRMTDLIEDLLTYSKTTSSLENFDVVNLNEILKEIIQLHREEFDQKKVSFEIVKLPVINAISFQMKQLLFNIINNSIKYKHPDREVHIQIKCDVVEGRSLYEWGADAFTNYYKISVIDNGIGFEAQYSERIFDIFQRLNNLPGTKGSGIGLAICKRIVQNHHGYIKAFGRENLGAQFDIYLPKNL